jgi:hypothetical protein
MVTVTDMGEAETGPTSPTVSSTASSTLKGWNSARGRAQSKSLVRTMGISVCAKRLECGAFTAAFARAACHRIHETLRPLESGAEATALQTLARLSAGLEPREAPGAARSPPLSGGR